MAALEAVGAANLAGKVVVDLALPLDFSPGMPPRLFVANTDSLGEQIQRAFPDARVVKTLNTVFVDVMVEPARVPGRHQRVREVGPSNLVSATRSLDETG
jgi:predicted dinucleotide-binding enzyme